MLTVILVLLIILGALWMFLRLLLWPWLRLAAKIVYLAWRARRGLKPWTHQGRWRLLGIGCLVIGVLLLAKVLGQHFVVWGDGVLDSILAVINIDSSGWAETGGGIAALLCSVAALTFASIHCFARAMRFDARPGSELLTEDRRSPVPYLRSFQDDPKAAWRIGMSQSGVNTEEGEIAEFVKSIGPLVAIGRPGEELSFFGAARIYAGARDWKKRVRRLLSKAPLVIVRAGHTSGLSWEMEQCRNLVQPEKLIVLIPFGRRRYDQFCAEVEGLFPCRLPEYNGRRVGETTIHAVLYFDSDWTPHLEPAVRETYLSYYSGRFAAKLEGDSIFVREQSHLHCILDNLLRPIIERSAHPARRMKSKAARS